MAFEGTSVCILSGFSGFNKLSGDIISRNIKKLGGVIKSQTDTDFSLLNLACIIVPENAQLDKIMFILSQSRLPSCPLVTPNWAIESYKKKKMQPFEKYLFIGNEIPAKRQENAENVLEPIKMKTHVADFNGSKRNDEFLSNGETLRAEFLENKEKFAFSQGISENLNEHLTSVLEILMENYFLLKDKARAFAYRFAIATLRSYPEKITCIHQAENLSKIGLKIKKKIQEILETGTLKRVQAMNDLDRLKSLKELSSVWGIGSLTANKLYSLGYKSVSDLKQNIPSMLNENQKICLLLYEDLSTKIPRQEVQKISEIVINYAKSLIPEQEITAHTCGSYRRGKELCGDIDVLLTFDDFLIHKDYLGNLVRILQEQRIVTHVLSLSVDLGKHESLSFSGIARMENGLHRRLDIKVYPKKTYAWALLHFTGSASFNRSIRLFAKTKGLKMTDEGLFPAIRNGSDTVVGSNLGSCYTEEDIFRLFGMNYKPPEERDI